MEGMPLDHFVTLGRSGLRVSPFCLGTMTFGEDHGWGASPAESESILTAYLERGGNFIDTANVYTNGHSEKIVGDYFASRGAQRDRVVIGTKFFGNLHEGDPNGGGAGRKAIIDQCEQSLRRLQMDYVDLYWLHNWDRRVPVEETLRALDDLVTSGKVRYIGFSDVPAWVAAEAQTIAGFRGLSPIIAFQLEYSLLERTAEGELFPMAQAHGMGVMPWSPLKSGFLSGKYSRGSNGSVDTRRGPLVGVPSERDYDVIDVLQAVATEVGATLIGARRLDHLHANLAGLDVRLTPAQLAALDAVSAPTLDFPAANNRDLAPSLGFGGTTIDGRTAAPWPLLTASPTRY
jgi:aryl-alcohol dehydrogenase-like predicted oxidoreductase